MSGLTSGEVAMEVEFALAACDCCRLTEECTPEYIAGVKEKYGGRWICGLCAEAVNDEICRSGPKISTEEAMVRHERFCKAFRSPAEVGNCVLDPTEQLILAVRQLLRRSLEGPRTVRSMPSSPRSKGEDETGLVLSRAGSCIPAIQAEIQIG